MSAFPAALGGTITVLGVGMVAAGRYWPARTAAVPVRDVIDELLDGGEVEANDFAYCPAEDRTRFHALRADGSRRCWTCQFETRAGVE